MASQTTKITAQFLHQTTEPLDKSAEVDNPEDLYNLEKVVAYVGKLVHVKSLRTTYVCAEAPTPRTAVWRPVMADDGTAFFVTTPAGEVFRISATRIDGQGRITVDIPSPTVPIINPPTGN